MAESRKVDTMPQQDSFADKLKKRRKYLEDEDVEGLQKTAKEMEAMQNGKKKKKEDSDE